MITYTKRKGRAGNRLFQLASLIGLSEKYGHELRLPKCEMWDCLKYFDIDIPEFTGAPDKRVIEPNFHYDPDFFEAELADKDKVIDVCGWLQTDKYFSSNKLRFKQDYKNKIWAEHGFSKPTIAISIRRGDFVNNPNYYQIPIRYYIGALFEHFPNWRDYDLVFFSDDPKYVRIHFGCLPNAHFPKLDPMDQLCLGSQCDHFVISNSTFSWWMAYLSENEDKKVVRPKKNLAGELEKTHDEKDFWPESFIKFEHEDYRINLKDVTFTIPISYDHNDRKQNLELSTCLLQQSFDTNIILMEQGGNKFEYMKEWCRYERFEGNDFHRTKMLNDMALMAETPIVANYDCDNVIPEMQIIEAVHKLRNGADMVYPFDGRSARVPRVWFRKMEQCLDAGILQDNFRGMDKYNSVGHAIFVNKQAFIEAGMENEYMISWAPEDIERFERFTKLGYKVERVAGPVFHMDHYCGSNSSSQNPHFQKNWAELERERRMTIEELRNYVAGFSWAHPYTNAYYETIIEEAVKSSKIVLEAFRGFTDLGHPNKLDSMIDIGGGCGEWGKDFGGNYVCVDFGIPKKRLLIPESNFIECDLGNAESLPIKERFDLCLCLEVAEHLPPQRSEWLVNTLCSLSDCVLFSAAIPGQPGVNHINCQWQSWWADLFASNGYYTSGRPFREMFIDNKDIAVWYRQNIVLYSKHFIDKAIDFVHPEMYQNIIQSLKQTA